MSRDSTTSTEKVSWQVRLNIDPAIKQKILDDAQKQDRQYSYVISRIVEKFYGQKTND